MEHHKEQHIPLLLHNNQFRFLEGRSVETAMFAALNDWVDLMKAFDKVAIPKPLLKKSMTGTHPMIVRWVREFLSNGRSKLG